MDASCCCITQKSTLSVNAVGVQVNVTGLCNICMMSGIDSEIIQM